jgi:hypothetical protein
MPALVESCVRKVDIEGGRIVVAPGFAEFESDTSSE